MERLEVTGSNNGSKSSNLFNLISNIGGVSNGGGIGGVGDMGGLDGLTGGLGDLVVDIATGDLGDGVAVLNLNGDNLDLGVVNTVLGGDLTASMLDGGGDGVSNSVSSNGGNSSNRGSSERSSDSVGSIGVSKELRVSLGISLTLSNGVVADSSRNNSGLVTDGVNNLLAHLLVFNLLGLNSLGVADVLGGGDAGLCHENLDVSLAVSSRNSGMVRSSSNELGISLSFGLGSCASKGEQTRNSKYLQIAITGEYFVFMC